MDSNKNMVKYHNDMNSLSLRKFTSREISLFYTICTFMRDRKDAKYELSFNDLKTVSGLNFQSKEEFHKYIELLADKLLSIILTLEDKNSVEKFVLFTTFKIEKDEEYISIAVNKDYLYFFNNLTKHFTLFDLQVLNSLSSSYAKHLYRLLKQYSSTGEYRVKIEKFRILLDIPKSYAMCDINKRVLDASIKELSSFFSNLTVEKIKKGRSIDELVFKFTPLSKQEIDVEFKVLKELPDIKETVDCPYCNQSLHTKTNKKTGEKFYGHQSYQLGKCKRTFSSLEEIEEHRKNKINSENEIDLFSEILAIQELNDPRVKILKFNNKQVFMEENNEVIIYNLSKNLITKLRKKLE